MLSLAAIVAIVVWQDQDIAARFGDQVITWKSVDQRAGRSGLTVTPRDRKEALRDLVSEHLVVAEARLRGIAAQDSQIDEWIKKETEGRGGAEEYERYLRSRGMSMMERRQEFRYQMAMVQLYRTLLRSNVESEAFGLESEEVGVGEIRDYYEKHPDKFRDIEHVTAWRIALKFSTPEERGRKQAVLETLQRKLKEGSDFYLLAGEYSEIWRSTSMGKVYGDQGLTRNESAYSKETNELLFDSLKEGQTSAIVADGDTLNLFRMVQKVKVKAQTLEEATPAIHQFLQWPKREANQNRIRKVLYKRSKGEPPNLFDDK